VATSIAPHNHRSLQAVSKLLDRPMDRWIARPSAWSPLPTSPIDSSGRDVEPDFEAFCAGAAGTMIHTGARRSSFVARSSTDETPAIPSPATSHTRAPSTWKTSPVWPRAARIP
jgi:hypothetical protein